MVSTAAARLEYLCNTLPALLKLVKEEEYTYRSLPGKWNKKEILGHLIDSAANNHQRFIRAQFELQPEISYDQDQWNACSHYSELPVTHLIQFWEVYNRHLLFLIQHIPPDAYSRKAMIKGEAFLLEYIIEDYVVHAEHHLRQIIDY